MFYYLKWLIQNIENLVSAHPRPYPWDFPGQQTARDLPLSPEHWKLYSFIDYILFFVTPRYKKERVIWSQGDNTDVVRLPYMLPIQDRPWFDSQSPVWSPEPGVISEHMAMNNPWVSQGVAQQLKKKSNKIHVLLMYTYRHRIIIKRSR